MQVKAHGSPVLNQPERTLPLELLCFENSDCLEHRIHTTYHPVSDQHDTGLTYASKQHRESDRERKSQTRSDAFITPRSIKIIRYTANMHVGTQFNVNQLPQCFIGTVYAYLSGRSKQASSKQAQDAQHKRGLELAMQRFRTSSAPSNMLFPPEMVGL